VPTMRRHADRLSVLGILDQEVGHFVGLTNCLRPSSRAVAALIRTLVDIVEVETGGDPSAVTELLITGGVDRSVARVSVEDDLERTEISSLARRNGGASPCTSRR